MSRKRKPKPRPLDVDGLTMAVDQLADLNPDAFEDVLELAYAYLFIHSKDREGLAKFGLITEGAAARAAKMLIDEAQRKAEGHDA